MIGLLRAVRDQVEALLEGRAFPAPPDGTLERPQVVIGALPPKRSGQSPDEDFPFIVVAPPDGRLGLRSDGMGVDLICGLYAPDSPEQGMEELSRLQGILAGLVRATAWATPWSIRPEAELRYGDDRGAHAPPFYYLTMSLTATAGPSASRRR